MLNKPRLVAPWRTLSVAITGLLISGRMDLDFRVATVALWHSKAKPVEVSGEEARARAAARRQAHHSCVALAATSFEHVKKPFSARNVDTPSRCIEKQIIRVARNLRVGDGLTGGRVENHEPRRLTAANEQ